MNKTQFTAKSARVEIGQTEPEFLKVFPAAEAKGAKATQKGNIKVYEVLYDPHGFPQEPGSRSDWGLDANGYYCRLAWFYFWNDKLVQWGKPNDWPENPDTIIEVRHR